MLKSFGMEFNEPATLQKGDGTWKKKQKTNSKKDEKLIGIITVLFVLGFLAMRYFSS